MDYYNKTHNSKDALQPYYKEYTSGLGICVDGLYGNKIEVSSYEFDGKKYKYTLHFVMYDIFGLEEHDIDSRKYKDILPYGCIIGFVPWYILQHYDKYAGAYKPFLTYIEFDRTFEGEIS